MDNRTDPHNDLLVRPGKLKTTIVFCFQSVNHIS